MTRNRTAFHTFLFIGLALAASVDLAHAGKKVTLCHRPPGDAGNAHTISVGEEALPAHLKHGDQLGQCPSGCQSNASICDDGNACTSDACLPDGRCEHTPVNCDDGNTCTVDSCNSTLGCLNAPAPAGTECDDGRACTSSDVCVGTTCVGSPVDGCCTSDGDCDDNNPCTVDSCSGNTCVNQPVDCSVTDRCLVGVCVPELGCQTTPVNCDDSNVCTDDHCSPTAGCYSTPTENPPEAHEVSCQDGADNDCDGLIDAADPDCAPAGVTYTGNFISGETPTTQCADWDAFRASLSSSTAYSTLTLSGTFDSSGVICSGPAANEIAQALRIGAPTSVACGGSNWIVGIGCSESGEPTVELALGADCSCDVIYTVRPCIGDQNWGGVNTATCGGPTQTITVHVQ